MSKKIVLKQDIEIRIFPSNHKLLYVVERLNKGIHYGYYINDVAYEIVKRMNGRYTYEELIEELRVKYSEDIEEVKKKVNNFIISLSSKYAIEVENKFIENEKEFIIIKNVEYEYPVVASLEVTNNCNIKCRHCYGEYGEKDIQNMPLDLGCKLLEELEELGVKIIEFTGGDVTVYREFASLLKKALSLNFSNIAILTNGVSISDEVTKIILENKERIVVQIDLHSLEEEYYNWFTQTTGHLEKVKYNITYLAEKGVRIKVVTIATPLNANELINIADWVVNNNIRLFGISAVLNMGRCINEDKEKILFLKEQDMICYVESLDKINEKYPNLIDVVERPAERNNCGAITANFVISPNGKIKICAMDNLSYCDSSIGNVFEKSVKQIFDDNSEFIQEFRELKAPNAATIECEQCENRFFCGNCVLRGIIKGSEKEGGCEWIKNIVPEIIQKKLFRGLI